MVPKKFVWLRNAQLTFCLAAVACTLTWSMFKFNNFVQLAGASGMGLLWGLVLFGNHMKVRPSFRVGLRVLFGFLVFLLYAVTTVELLLNTAVGA